MLRTCTTLVGLAVASLVGCAVSDVTDIPSAGGTGSGTGGTGGPTGGSSTGGVATGGVATGGVSTGGVSTGGVSTGGVSTGGSSTGGTGGSIGGASGTGAAGASGAGMGGSSGDAGAGGAGKGGMGGGGTSGNAGAAGKGGTSGTGGSGGGTMGAATPSPGCSKGSTGTKISKANEEIVDFPSSYNGTKPFPLLMMLHACGNANNQWENLTNQRGPTALVNEYIRWMPNTTAASGQCWSNYANDVARIKSQYDQLLNNYCVDTSRIFGIGHSSGAQMLVNMMAHSADAQYLKLAGVAPVAADPYNVAQPTPVLYIDGIMDNQRSANSARDAVARFRTANMCMTTNKPYTEIMGCKSYQNQAQVDPGCIIYDGCSVPTIWCAHNDPDYGNTQHGVPCFATQAMYDFFKKLRP